MRQRSSLSKTTVLFHWVTGLAFLAVFGFGLYIADLPRSPEKWALLHYHKSFGLLILILAVLRLLWRLREGFLEPLSSLPAWQARIVKLVHLGLLISTLTFPLSGLMMNIGGGRPTELFGFELLAAGNSIEWLSWFGRGIHDGSVKVVMFALLLHVGGAIKHQLVDRDGSLFRILGR
ncbi:cytochrome b [Thaumasiovibrio subtropicus]|uniref:cytochrome b n=1 Tax=Thaumasiovibrio subtropicus TaxID=1891207 RepID=UPI000B353E43|nr:cytochrome b [Thaumasiovibrio subtropicus]